MERVRILFFAVWLISVAWAAEENYKPESFSDELLKKAEAGDAEAQCKLAGAYREGRGIEKNAGESLKWLNRSAESGFAIAELILARDLIEGSTLPKDPGRAEQLLLRAEKKLSTNHGPYSAKVQYFLGMFYLNYEKYRDLAKAHHYLRSAAQKNDSCAQHVLGKLYAEGVGVEKNESLALEYFEKAVTSNTACAHAYFAEYFLKRGEYAAAREWFEKAAQQKEKEAMVQLGFLHRKGQGTNPDLKLSSDWFEKAARQGDLRGKYEWAKNQKLGGDDSGALRIFTEIAEEPLDPGDPDKNYRVGVASLEAGNFEKAKQAMQQGSPMNALGARSLRTEGMKRPDPDDPVLASSVEILDESLENIGSGVLVGKEGKVLTAAHVVAEKTRLFVRDSAMRTTPVLGFWTGQPEEDLVILQTEALDRAGAVLSDRMPELGDTIKIVGHPAQTISVISSEGSIHRLMDGGVRACSNVGVFHGFSGSGVFNSAGQLVGVVISSHGDSPSHESPDAGSSIHTGFESLPRLQAIVKKSEQDSLRLPMEKISDLKNYGASWNRKKNDQVRNLEMVKSVLTAETTMGKTSESSASALRLLVDLAGAGNPDAQFFLGLCYSEGRGCSTNYTKAAEQFLLAATQGESCAKHHLGMLYLNGWGVPQDDAKAHKWLEEASKDPPACGKLFLAFYYHRKKDFEKAVYWYRLAKEQGDPRADAYLSEIRGLKVETPQ
jgi:TPR repeat protein